MRGWTNDEHLMIACCNDGTRPVIFKIERLDYKVLHVNADELTQIKISDEIKKLDGVFNVIYRKDKNFTEIFMDRNREVGDEKILSVVKTFGDFDVRID